MVAVDFPEVRVMYWYCPEIVLGALVVVQVMLVAVTPPLIISQG